MLIKTNASKYLRVVSFVDLASAYITKIILTLPLLHTVEFTIRIKGRLAMFEQIPDLGASIIPLSVFILCNAVGVIVSKFFFHKVGQISQKLSGIYYIVIINSLKGMPTVWGLIIGSYSAIHLVAITPYWLHLLEAVFLVIIVFSATLIVARVFSGVVKVYALTAEGIFPTASILANLAEVSIYLIGMLILLQSFGISITPILTALGVGGLAVALALQDTLSNVFPDCIFYYQDRSKQAIILN
jgi:small-conductance mechanosensitive channel